MNHDQHCETQPGGRYYRKTIAGCPIPCHCAAREAGRKQAEREIARSARSARSAR